MTDISGTSEIPAMVSEVLFIFFSVIGIILATISSILMRKREFGIRLAVGDSIRGIFTQILIENFIIAFIGLCSAIIYFYLKYQMIINYTKFSNKTGTLDFKLDFPIIFIVFLFLCFIIFLSNLIVLLFLRKLEPKELIGGVE